MTKREFCDAIIAANINDEMTAFAQAMKDGLDKTNAARKEKAVEKAAEKEALRAPIREAIVACIDSEPKTATMLIAEAGVEVTPQMIPHLLKALVEDGTLQKVKVKIKNKGDQVGYIRA